MATEQNLMGLLEFQRVNNRPGELGVLVGIWIEGWEEKKEKSNFAFSGIRVNIHTLEDLDKRKN